LQQRDNVVTQLFAYLDRVGYKHCDDSGNKLPWVAPDEEGENLMREAISIDKRIEILERRKTVAFQFIEVSIRERQPIRKMSAKDADLVEDPDCEKRTIYVTDQEFEDVDTYWNEFMQTVYTPEMEFREDEMTMCMTRRGYGPCPCCGEFIGYTGERDY